MYHFVARLIPLWIFVCSLTSAGCCLCWAQLPLNALASKHVHVARAVHSDGARVLSFLEAQLHWMACLEIKHVTPGVNILSPHVRIYQCRKYKWKIDQKKIYKIIHNQSYKYR